MRSPDDCPMTAFRPHVAVGNLRPARLKGIVLKGKLYWFVSDEINSHRAIFTSAVNRRYFGRKDRHSASALIVG